MRIKVHARLVGWLPLLVLALLPLGYFLEGGGGEGVLTQLLYAIGWVVLAALLVSRGLPVVAADALWVSWLMVMLAAPIVHQGADKLLSQVLHFLAVGVGTILFCRVFVRSSEDIDRFFRIHLGLGFMVGVWVIVRYIQSGAPLGSRFEYAHVHPIPLALLGAVLVLVSYIYYAYRRIRLSVCLMLLGVGIMLMLISASKGPLVALILTMIAMLPITIARIGALRNFLVLGVASAAAVWSPQVDFLTTRILQIGQDESTTMRLAGYDRAIDAWSSSPLTGSPMALDGYPHNLVLEVLLNHGIFLGLVLAAVLGVVAVKYVRLAVMAKEVKLATAATYGLLLLSLGSVLVSWSYLDHKFLFVGFGLALNLSVFARADGSRSPLRIAL